jgi:hypothetical protein
MARQTKTNEAPPIARPICTAEITIKNRKPLATDLANFTAALDGAGATDAFMNASSPGVISAFLPNEYYPSEDAYLEALCNVMREQYEAIVEAGFILQVDCPDVAMARHTQYKHLSDDEFVVQAGKQVAVLNTALAMYRPNPYACISVGVTTRARTISTFPCIRSQRYCATPNRRRFRSNPPTHGTPTNGLFGVRSRYPMTKF